MVSIHFQSEKYLFNGLKSGGLRWLVTIFRASLLNMSRSRNWCFTLNNYSDEQYAIITKPNDSIKYMIVGKEIAETGTPHLQGYVMFKNAVRFSTMTSWLPGAHFEVAKGSPEHNYDYCSKEGNFEEFGIRPDPEARLRGMQSDIEALPDTETFRELALQVDRLYYTLLQVRSDLNYLSDSDDDESIDFQQMINDISDEIEMDHEQETDYEEINIE